MEFVYDGGTYAAFKIDMDFMERLFWRTVETNAQRLLVLRNAMNDYDMHRRAFE